jgi:flagellar protein FliT
MTDPAEALLELARAELRAASEGRVDDLAELHDERDRLLAALPARPGPGQAATLTRALAVQGEVADLLRRTRDAVAAELQHVDQGRATLRGYAAAGLGAGRTFDSVG